MKNLKLLVCVMALTLGLGLATPVLAQSSGCDPGQMNTPCGCQPIQIPMPPCASAQLATDDSTNPGQTETPPASDAVSLAPIAEAAITTLLLFTVN